ncbi:MAG: hypothetical protein ABI162_06810 [Luteolibacter sp.]
MDYQQPDWRRLGTGKYDPLNTPLEEGFSYDFEHDELVSVLDRQLWRPPYPGYETEGATLARKILQQKEEKPTEG